MLRSILLASLALIAAGGIVFIGLAGRVLSEGTSPIAGAPGYVIFDTSVMRVQRLEADGSIDDMFGPDVKSLEVRGDALFVAQRPFDGARPAPVADRLECRFWRIDLKTRHDVQVTQAEARLWC